VKRTLREPQRDFIRKFTTLMAIPATIILLTLYAFVQAVICECIAIIHSRHQDSYHLSSSYQRLVLSTTVSTENASN
jgi:hypothetical protein